MKYVYNLLHKWAYYNIITLHENLYSKYNFIRNRYKPNILLKIFEYQNISNTYT